MGKRKIIWSHRARIKLFQILEFYAGRNKSKAYSLKLNKEINKQLSQIQKQPEIGLKSEVESVRGLVFENFIIFYEIEPHQIVVHTIWDCRQNPDDLNIINS
jgi:plasmid stabilization system protein ParE